MGGNLLTLGNLSMPRRGAHITIIACSEVCFHTFMLDAYLSIESVLIYIRYLVAINHISPSRTYEIVLHLGIGVCVGKLNGQLDGEMPG